MAKYRCKHCGKVVERDSDKEWIKSYCSETGRDTHITKVKNDNYSKDEA